MGTGIRAVLGVGRDGYGPQSVRRLDLDVVRGIAILLAMGWHLSSAPTHFLPIDWIFAPGRMFGWAGVDLFFVLSGFLMGKIILRERSGGGFDARRFMVRRAFKLWPVLYLFLIGQLLVGDHGWRTFLPQVLLHVQNFLGSAHEHLWSLAVEEHFYLGIALLFPLLLRWGTSTRLLAVIISAVVFLPLPLRVACWWSGSSADALQQQTQFRIDGLAAGMLLALVATHRPEFFSRLLRLRGVWIAVCGLAVLFLCVFPKHSAVVLTVGFTVTWVGSVSLILLVSDNSLIEKVRWIFTPIALAGFYSYSIYIWHLAAAGALGVVLVHLGVSLPLPVLVVLKYLAAISVAVILTRIIERPMLRLRDRLFPARSRVVEGVRTERGEPALVGSAVLEDAQEPEAR